jgi:hypothetical protein
MTFAQHMTEFSQAPHKAIVVDGAAMTRVCVHIGGMRAKLSSQT